MSTEVELTRKRKKENQDSKKANESYRNSPLNNAPSPNSESASNRVNTRVRNKMLADGTLKLGMMSQRRYTDESAKKKKAYLPSAERKSIENTLYNAFKSKGKKNVQQKRADRVR